MRQIIGRALWLGNAGDLRDARAVLAADIGAVVELADSEQFAILPRELVRCRFPIAEGGDNPSWLLRLAAESVATLIRAGVPTLVCCASGLSRSVCIAAGGLALVDGIPLEDALVRVARFGVADVSPGLLVQIIDALTRGSSRSTLS
jgi:hypothetical protein